MIKPMLNQYNATQFSEAKEIIEQGKQEAEKTVPKILKLMEDWKESNNEGNAEPFK